MSTIKERLQASISVLGLCAQQVEHNDPDAAELLRQVRAVALALDILVDEGQRLQERVTTLEADNMALTARNKELEAKLEEHNEYLREEHQGPSL
jgi:chromosome segregation ATPase